MMLRLSPHVAALAVLLAAQQASAQRQVRDESLGVMVSFQSKLLWRDITLADAPAFTPLGFLRKLRLRSAGAAADLSHRQDRSRRLGSVLCGSTLQQVPCRTATPPGLFSIHEY